jgi:hypothetical protein
MFTTGSKLLIGAAVMAIVAAIVYGTTQDGIMGTIGLVSAAIGLSFLAGINVWMRDSNVRPDDPTAGVASSAARPAPGPSSWPLVGVVGATLVVVGLVSYQVVTIVGIAVLVAAIAEWTVQAWSERASGDVAYNEEVRERIASPLELPVLGAIGLGVIIFGISRVMLSLTKSGTVVAFAVIAALVLVAAFLLAARPRITGGTVAGVCSVALIAVVAGGTVAGVDGERDIHPHETIGEVAERGGCGPEETEADENASQNVSAKASLAVTVTLTADGKLTYDQPGADLSGPLTLQRSNATNVLFRNESDEDRRLNADVGPVSGDVGAASTDTEQAEEQTRTICTALVEPDGVQLLTITYAKPSSTVEGGYRFYVPGVDTAEMEVVVP